MKNRTVLLLASLSLAFLCTAETVAAQTRAREAVGVSDVQNAPVEQELVAPPAEVEASVEEMETIINLPRSAQLRREADEDPENPANIFADEEELRRLLGDRPRFVYFPEGVDPMIIPWIRNQIVAGELLGDAKNLFQQAQQRKDRELARRALEIAEEIVQKYSDTAEANEARMLAETARRIVEQPVQGQETKTPVEVVTPAPTPYVVTLPQRVTSETLMTIVDLEHPSDSVVMVGRNLLRPGDTVPEYPQVTVKEINAGSVIYEYQGQTFLVNVTGRR